MKGIYLKEIKENKYNSKRRCSTSNKVEKSNGYFVLAEPKGNEYTGSRRWTKYLCTKTPTTPFRSINGFSYFIDNIWEEFYDVTTKKITDPFELKKFNQLGSESTYCACWLKQDKGKTYYQWLSYGNTSLLVYDKKQDELFVPEYDESLIGFLKNKGTVNWNGTELLEEYLLSSPEKELDSDKEIILASAAMAEYLVLSYLIIKSKSDEYWEKLSRLMESDSQLSNIIFNNRSAYEKTSFSEVLDEWQQHSDAGTVNSFAEQLRNENKLSKGNVTLLIISYNPDGEELLTENVEDKTVSLRQSYQTVPVKIPLPKAPPSKPKFKVKQDAFIDILLDNKVQKLHHFTDRANLDSIKKLGGLYSWDYMLRKGLTIPRQGGSQLSKMLDARHGLENFVRLSICSNHPMLHAAKAQGRIIDPVILEIDPVVVTWYDTLFSDRNAASNAHRRGGSLQDLSRIHFNSCLKSKQFDLDEDEQPFYQAEILVWEFIPLKYILNINKI